MSHCSGVWKSKIRMPARLGSGENPLPSYRLLTAPCVVVWQRAGLGEEVSSPVTFIRALIPGGSTP